MIVTFLTRIHNCSKIDKMKNGEYYLILLQSKASPLILKNYWWSWSLLVFVYKKKKENAKKKIVKISWNIAVLLLIFFSKWSRFKTSDRTRLFEKEIVIRGNTYTPSSNRMMPITLKIPARGLSKTMTTHTRNDAFK